MGMLAELGDYGPLGATGLVVLVIILIFRGKLVPSRYYDEALRSRDEALEAVDKKDDIIAELVEQQKVLLVGNLTTKRVIEALPPPLQGG